MLALKHRIKILIKRCLQYSILPDRKSIFRIEIWKYRFKNRGYNDITVYYIMLVCYVTSGNVMLRHITSLTRPYVMLCWILIIPGPIKGKWHPCKNIISPTLGTVTCPIHMSSRQRPSPRSVSSLDHLFWLEMVVNKPKSS